MFWLLTIVMAAWQAAPQADAGRGQVLFVKYGCNECHGGDGQGAPSSGPRIGPNPLALAAFTRAVRTPRNYMPPYTNKVVSDQDLADIHAFLSSRPRPASPATVDGASAAALIAPGGTLRVGINYGNLLLAARAPGETEAHGVAVDLARELGRRVSLPVAFVGYGDPGALGDAVARNEWDVAFLAADPDRMALLDFTQPYLEIDVSYLVAPGAAIRSVQDVDRAGIRIATGARSAYTLFLSRTLKNAELARMTTDQAVAEMSAGRVQALAGLRFALAQTAARVPGSRVLPDTLTRAQQAIAVRKGSPALAYLEAFVSDIRSSGLVADAIGRTGLSGAAPAR